MQRTRFIREVGGVALLVVATFVLTLYLAPAKVVVKTETVTQVAQAVRSPVHAQRYVDAFCTNDETYLVEHTSPSAFDPAAIRAGVAQAVRAGASCHDIRYLGAYRTKDAHVFTVVFSSSGRENFVIMTFDDSKMLVGID